MESRMGERERGLHLKHTYIGRKKGIYLLYAMCVQKIEMRVKTIQLNEDSVNT